MIDGLPTLGCPCGSGQGYEACCGRLHRGRADAATAEELMRSRYSAFAKGDAGYLWRTWHPDARPATVDVEDDVTWVGLDVLDVVAGGSADETGEVEFRARYTAGGLPDVLHERSRFARLDGRWVYVDGTHRD